MAAYMIENRSMAREVYEVDADSPEQALEMVRDGAVTPSLTEVDGIDEVTVSEIND